MADLTLARKVLETEAAAILALVARLDARFEHAVDLFISTGDVFDLANSTTVERDAVSDWLIAMANVCDVLVVDGNHGSAADIEQLAFIFARERITINQHLAGIWFH